MTADSDFLTWIHARLEHVHGENPLYDYMWKLRALAEEAKKRELKKLAKKNRTHR